MTLPVIDIRHIHRIYETEAGLTHALRGVSLTVERGEFLAIMGPSGSGKSTLMNILGCLDSPTSGSYRLEGLEVSTLDDDDLAEIRATRLGFVFQSFNLLPTLNVYENIVFPIQLDGSEPDETFVNEVIDAIGLTEMKERLPNQLSGGQQQRVAIARALAAKPAMILADEPTGNLDSKTSQDVLSLLKVTGQRFSQTIVMITHNEAIAQMADRIIRIEDGHIIKGGEQND